MTNNYDAQDLDAPQQYQPPIRGDVSEAAGIRSRLTSNLRDSVTEARNLSNFYDNLARQLELVVAQVENKR